MKEDIPGNIHRRFYHKSDKVNAPENQNPEFQVGYRPAQGKSAVPPTYPTE
jgi:hypothetical protein